MDHMSARTQFTSYLNGLPQHVSAYDGINPFWRAICENVGAKHHTVQNWEEADDLIHQLSSKSLNFLLDRLSPIQFDEAWANMLAALNNPAPEHGGKGAAEQALVLAFFAERGISGQMRNIARTSRLAPAMGVLRHAYYAEAIARHAPPGDLHVLEIGGGSGALKFIMRALLGARIASWTDVDLPEVLPFAIRNTIEFFPDDVIAIDSASRAPHVFLSADRTDLIDDKGYNLILNTHSFQEMDDTVISEYFDTIYRAATPGAIFYNTNWRAAQMTRLNGEFYDNNPRAYPYRETDEVLYFGPCDLHEYGRVRGRKAKVECVTSIRRLA